MTPQQEKNINALMTLIAIIVIYTALAILILI
jgi:hypothetical protein